MLNDHRSTVAMPRPWIVVTTAALATLAALSFLLLRPAPGDAAAAKGPVVSTASSSLGRILVNSRGHTLYLFEKDKHGKSACVGKCATFWPPAYSGGSGLV